MSDVSWWVRGISDPEGLNYELAFFDLQYFKDVIPLSSLLALFMLRSLPLLFVTQYIMGLFSLVVFKIISLYLSKVI